MTRSSRSTCARLVELEYLLVHRTRTGGLEYELVYDVGGGENTVRFPGLADVEALGAPTTARGRGKAMRGRGLVGGRSAPGRWVVGAMKLPQSKRLRGLAAMQTVMVLKRTAARHREDSCRTRRPVVLPLPHLL